MRTWTDTELVEKPAFGTELRNAETLLGNDANFACKLTGKPAPQVLWSVYNSAAAATRLIR